MKLVYTDRALLSLEECLNFLAPEITPEKINEVRDRILGKADQLVRNPFLGQEEPYLMHLGLSHRRVIEGNYKIIYRVEANFIYITDIFDTRQNPDKMEPRAK